MTNLRMGQEMDNCFIGHIAILVQKVLGHVANMACKVLDCEMILVDGMG